MSEAIVILITAGDEPVYRWFEPTSGEPATGSAADVAAAFTDDGAVTVLLTSAHVLLTEVSVKVRNRSVLHKAVTYALEDQLADDVEDLVIEPGPVLADDTYPVAVVARSIVDAVRADLSRAGLTLARCVPYVFVLPESTPNYALLTDGTVAVVRTGRYAGFTATPDNLPALLARIAGERGDEPSSVQFVVGDASPLPDLRSRPPQVIDPASFAIWAGGNIGAGPNLGFAVAPLADTPTLGRKLAIAAVLLLAALVAHTGFVYSRTAANEQRLAETQAQTREIFSAAFPAVKRVINPKVQAERLLTRLRDNRPQGLAFLDGMASLGSALQALHGEALIRSVRYRAGRFDVSLDAPDIAALEHVRAALAASDLGAEIVSADNRDERIRGRLQFGPMPQ